MRSNWLLCVLCSAVLCLNSGCRWPTAPTDLDNPANDTGAAAAPSVLTVSVALNNGVFATQQQSAWCWAATIANLFAYHGHPVAQARIVSEVYGAPVNMRSGDYSNLARLLNRGWRDDLGRPFTSRLTAALDVPNGVDAISNDQIRDALRANRPLVIGTTEHAMLVIGMSYTESNGRVADVRTVRVFDPWPGRGARTLTASEMTAWPRGGSLLFIADALVSQ